MIITRERKFLQNLILSRDEPVRSTETRQRWKHARRLPYGIMAEKKDKNTTLHIQHYLPHLIWPCSLDLDTVFVVCGLQDIEA